VTHVFPAPSDIRHRIDASLTVRDPHGLTSTMVIPVWPGNRPPIVELSEPRDGFRYDAASPQPVRLDPTVGDPDADALTCRWELTLLHDAHSHPWGGLDTCAGVIELGPTPCSGSTYAYTLTLTVTDSLGLATVISRTLMPRCIACPADMDGSDLVDFGDLAVLMLEYGTTGISRADLDGNGLVDFGDVSVAMLSFGPCD
jgi:hypothetical protein